MYVGRYKGFADVLHAFRQVGLLQNKEEDKIVLDSWHELVARAASKVTKEDIAAKDVVKIVPQLIAAEKVETVVPAFEWYAKPFSNNACGQLSCMYRIGAVPSISGQSDVLSLPPVPRGPVTPLDALAALLSHKLRYEPHERDLVLLSHEIITAPISPSSEPTPNEVYNSTMAVYGSASGSAMSKTVGLPLAFAALRVLDGGVRARGVTGPFGEEVYKPVLAGLADMGFGMRET